MGSTLREIRFALRRLVRGPVLTATVVTTVALGIGGTTAVYSLVHGVLIEPLPYPEPERLVRIHTARQDQEWGFSMADYLALAEQGTAFEEVAAFDPNGTTLTTPEGAERILTYGVTPSFFRALGIQPALGRGFTDDEAAPEAPRVAVLSWGFWQSRMGGDPGVLGQVVELNQEPHQVVGVLPRTVGPIEGNRELLTNLTLAPPRRKGPFFLQAIARVRRDVAPEVASEELRAINARIWPIWRDSYPDQTTTWTMRDLKDSLVGTAADSLWLLLGAVGFLLLIACTNVANLLVARGVEQQAEMSVRAALGASRRRLLAHVLTESGLLTAVGALGGLGLAAGAVRVATTLGSEFLLRTSEVGLTPPVLLFFAAVTGSAFLLAGVIPAIQSSGGTVRPDIGSGARSASSGTSARRVRRALVGFQFAVAAPLLIGGGLLLGSLNALSSLDPGFDADQLLTVGMALPSESRAEMGRLYQDPDGRRAFWYELWDRVQSLPGVVAVGTADGRPPDDPGFGNNFILEDRPLAEGESQWSVPWTIASPGYFEALGVKLLAGSMFDMRVDAARVAMVDETWARRFFDDPQDAVGRRFLHGGCTIPGDCEWWTVIGVVSDVEYNGLSAADEGAMYLDGERFSRTAGYLAVRTATSEPANLLPAVRGIIREMEPGAPIMDVATGRELLRESLQQPRYLAALVGVFGALALLLSLVGVYGVMAYFVEQHRRDIGIRLALGSEPGMVSRLVLFSAMRVVLAGTVLGMGAALVLGRFMEGLLFGVGARDPITFGLVATGLLITAVLATWVPAHRAASTDPVRALRWE